MHGACCNSEMLERQIVCQACFRVAGQAVLDLCSDVCMCRSRGSKSTSGNNKYQRVGEDAQHQRCCQDASSAGHWACAAGMTRPCTILRFHSSPVPAVFAASGRWQCLGIGDVFDSGVVLLQLWLVSTDYSSWALVCTTSVSLGGGVPAQVSHGP